MRDKKKFLFIKYFVPTNLDQRTIGALLTDKYDVSYLSILDDVDFKYESFKKKRQLEEKKDILKGAEIIL